MQYSVYFSVTGTTQCMFWGLDGDGTIGAKAAIKNLALDDGLNAQGYFNYDSHKEMEATISHLRFGRVPIRARYMINPGRDENACHHPSYVRKFDLLADCLWSFVHRKAFLCFSPSLTPLGGSMCYTFHVHTV